MSASGNEPEDLSGLARRGLLSSLEEEELARELSRSVELRVTHQVGLDLDRSTAVRAGDEALVGRAADAALARVGASGLSPQHARSSKGRRRALSMSLAAALVSVTCVAAAMWAGVVPARWFRRAAPRQDSTTAAPVTHATEPEAALSVVAPVAPAFVPAVPTGGETGAPLALGAGATVARAPAVAATVVAQRAPDATAASLFTSANAARRDGNFAIASKLYKSLIATYPSSDEAKLARVSLGKLLLSKGDPSDAEHEFDQYLKGGHGQLTEEALVSQGQSLQKMGRSAAEQRTWQRLLAEYPNSVYARVAKGRLEALRRDPSTPAP